MAPSKNYFFRLQIILGLAGLLIALQIFDGILTYMGVSRLGIEAEGNSILSNYMHIFGVAQTLVVAKLFGILLILGLVRFSNQVRWLPVAMGALAFMYTSAAIVPWTLILFS